MKLSDHFGRGSQLAQIAEAELAETGPRAYLGMTYETATAAAERIEEQIATAEKVLQQNLDRRTRRGLEARLDRLDAEHSAIFAALNPASIGPLFGSNTHETTGVVGVEPCPSCGVRIDMRKARQETAGFCWACCAAFSNTDLLLTKEPK